MTDRHPIRNQVIGGVITALILGIGALVLGVAQPIGKWLINGSLSLPAYVVVTIGLLASAAGGRVLVSRRRLKSEPTSFVLTTAGSGSDLEVRPVRFIIDLSRSVPRVEVELLAINYLSAELSLRHAVVSRLTFESGFPALDGIGLVQEFHLGPRSSRFFFCERPLADSEARTVRAAFGRCLNGSVSVLARGTVAGQEVQSLVSAHVIVGWVTSPPADVA